MRKLKLLLVAFMAMSGLGVNAQSWTAPTIQGEDPVSGTQYKVMNVGANKYLDMGKSWFGWSTTAILSDNGINFTMTADGDNWKFIRTGNQGVFTSGNDIPGDAMHVDNTAHTYGITKMPNGNYQIHDVVDGEYTTCWGYIEHNSVWGPVAHANASTIGTNGEWMFVTPSAFDFYSAQLKLYEALVKAEAKGADVTSQGEVYKNSESTIEQLNAAYETVKTILDYFEAVDNAKAVDQTAKMRASLLTALQEAITAYGNLDSSNPNLGEATSALIAATANANTSINSYKVIAAGSIPDNSLDGWICTNSNTFHINTWSGEGNSDGSNMKTPFIENWVGKGSFLGEGTVSYTLEGLEPGEVYYAQALVRSYNEASSDAPNGPNFFINNVEVSLPTAGTTFTYNNMSGIYATLGDQATIGADGKLTLGVKIAADRNYNWVAFKNVTIQALNDAYNTAKAKATDLNGKIPSGLYDELSTFLSSHADVTIANIKAIEAEVEKYVPFITPYATWLEVKNGANALANTDNNNAEATTTLKSAISAQTIIADAATTAEVINQAATDLKPAAMTFINAAAPAEGKTFEVSFLLVNRSFENNNFTGWVNSGMAVQTNNSFEKVGDIYAEVWQPNGTKSVKQNLEGYPAGKYSISAKAKARGVTSARLFGGAEEKAITIADASDTYTVEFFYDGTDKLTFGFEGVGTGAGSSWLCVDDFTMSILRAANADDYKASLNTILAEAETIITDGTNVGTAAFQIPVAAQTTLNDVMTAAQTIYDNAGATISEVQTAISDLTNAIETYNNAELNAPAADKLYNIINISEGYNHTGKAVTFKSASDADLTKNTTTMGYTESPGSTYPQGVKFTATGEPNTYILSYTRADGKTVYVGTGSSTGLGSTNDQLRPTTDAEKAVAIKVVATATEGVWNLYNTLANKNIGANGADDQGFYTTNQFNSMKIQEAAANEVVLNITAANQYGTLIVPFDAAIPLGVVAYSCGKVDGTTLKLSTEETSFKANTPYIVFAEASITETLSGIGAAYKDATYTAGLLTGIYADTDVPVGSYILQNQNDVVAFYVVEESKQPTLKANHAYLTVDGNSAREALYFGGDATGIMAIDALTSGNATIFNAAGAQIPALQKGMNIVRKADGKSYKVIVK